MFLCFGLPKSGTTFLQRILDAHPDVSCPSEQDFDYLRGRLQDCFSDYNGILDLKNRRTGGQPLRAVQTQDFPQIFGDALKAVIRALAGGKSIAGANDNGVVVNLPFYFQVLGRPKMICIFRHPLDRAVSAWHHNLRLSEAENDPKHRAVLLEAGGFDGWVLQAARIFDLHVKDFSAFGAQTGKTLTVRYEDLVDDRRGQMEKVFDFLGADTAGSIMDSIVRETGLERMREDSGDPAFFRKGTHGYWRDEVAAETADHALRIAADGLTRLGYLP